MSVGPLAVAIIGAGGAILGSAVSTVPTAWLAHRQDLRGQRAADKIEADEARLACRLVAQELSEAAQMLAHTSTGRFWPGLRLLPTELWSEYRSVLAGSVAGPADWSRLVEAYDEVRTINWTVDERRGTSVSVDSRSLGEQVMVDDDPRSSWLVVQYAIGILQLSVGDIAMTPEEVLGLADELWPPA